MSQALGILQEQKYEAEGGPPSLKSCADLLKRVSIRPAADLADQLLWTVFNYVIGNADAHAKNISILYTPKGPCLAPITLSRSSKLKDEKNVWAFNQEKSPDGLRSGSPPSFV